MLRLLILFGRNAVGCLNNPYTTYRKLAYEKTEVTQTIFIFILAVLYFIYTSFARIGIHHPYLLTLKFNTLVAGAIVSFLGMVGLLYLLGKMVGGGGTLKTLLILWAYSLLPTVSWFFMTSFAFIVIPPPRTMSIWGKMFTVFFIALTFSLLFWKLILYYLTLRFGMRLDLWRIAVVSLIATPMIIIYALILYRMGIFRVPFI